MTVNITSSVYKYTCFCEYQVLQENLTDLKIKSIVECQICFNRYGTQVSNVANEPSSFKKKPTNGITVKLKQSEMLL